MIATMIQRFLESLNQQKSAVYIQIEIPLLLTAGKIPGPSIPLYSLDENKEASLIWPGATPLGELEVRSFHQSGIHVVYFKREHLHQVSNHVQNWIDALPSDSHLAHKKAELLHSSASHYITDAFQNPTPDTISKGVQVVSRFVHTLMKDPAAYDVLLSLSSHDPYTVQHSVGVASHSIILAKKMGIIEEQTLVEVGLGGLFHDIGKTKVPVEIINKPGPLNDDEWKIMRIHAAAGYEIVKDNPDIGSRAKFSVLQHHEDNKGTGYPNGLIQSDLDLFSRVVAICDIFNALTTNRSYSKARSAFDAFQLMKQNLQPKLDPKLFDALVLIYGGNGRP